MAGLQFFTFKKNLPGVGAGYLGNDANERGFAGAVGAQQPKNATLRDLETHIIEGQVVGVSFTYFFDLQHSFCAENGRV